MKNLTVVEQHYKAYQISQFVLQQYLTAVSTRLLVSLENLEDEYVEPLFSMSFIKISIKTFFADDFAA